MSEDHSRREFFKVGSFDDAETIMDKLTGFDYAMDYMESGEPDYLAIHGDIPDWMREPVWIIEITVRRA